MESKDKEDLDNINRITSLFEEYWKLYDQYLETHDQSLTSRIDDVVDEMGKRICKLESSFKDLDYFSKLDEESFKAKIDKKDEPKELLRLSENELDTRDKFKIGSIKYRYHTKKSHIIRDRTLSILLKKN